MAKEVNGLLQAINEGLLDDLDHDIPPGSWIADDYGV
jgi:DNA-binding XRE family transcriptional regulator